ncbi:MAG: hypothetical protein Q9196_004348 [Gyalolechia fulgens]
MRSATIVSALLAGGAFATPVANRLEERAIVYEQVTTTTVVWVTSGQPLPTTPVTVPTKAAVVPGHNPHHRPHTHVAPQPAPPASVPAPVAAPAPPPPSPAAIAPVPEKSVVPVAEQPATSLAAALSPQPLANSGSNPGSSSAPISSADNLDTTSDVYKALVLEHHNIHRANHSADDLTWDDTLATYAEQSAKTCVWEHNMSPGGGGYGQNIAAGYAPNDIAVILTNMFYNDEMMLFPGYGSDKVGMDNFHKWGHFSQMLWQPTKKVGCYTYTCSPAGASPLDCNPSSGQSYLKGDDMHCGNGGINAIFTVCNYSPAGNDGKYSNVGAPLGKPYVHAQENGVPGV